MIEIEKTDYAKIAADAALVIMAGVDKFEKQLTKDGEQEITALDSSILMTYTNAIASHIVLACVLTMMTKLGLPPESYDEVSKIFVETGIGGYLASHTEHSQESLKFIHKVLLKAQEAGLDQNDLTSPEIKEFLLSQHGKKEEAE